MALTREDNIPSGATVRLFAYFKDAQGDLIDPETIPTVEILDPSEVVYSTLTPTRQTLGLWFVDFTTPTGITAQQIWEDRWTATVDDAARVEEFSFVIVETIANIEGAYCQVIDLRNEGISINDRTDDEVRDAILEAKIRIDAFVGHDFLLKAGTFLFDGRDKRSIQLPLALTPIVQITALTLDDIVVNLSDLAIYEDVGIVTLKRFTSTFPRFSAGVFSDGDQNVEVAGQFGYLEVPPEVSRACLDLSIWIMRNKASQIALTEDANTVINALGLKSAQVDKLKVVYEYPRVMREQTLISSTGSRGVDNLLRKFRHRPGMVRV